MDSLEQMERNISTYEKCGEVLTVRTAEKRCYALKCLYCEKSFMALFTFIDHIEEFHIFALKQELKQTDEADVNKSPEEDINNIVLNKSQIASVQINSYTADEDVTFPEDSFVKIEIDEQDCCNPESLNDPLEDGNTAQQIFKDFHNPYYIEEQERKLIAPTKEERMDEYNSREFQNSWHLNFNENLSSVDEVELSKTQYIVKVEDENVLSDYEEPENFTNEPLPSMREPIKIQGVRAAPKTRAQIQRDYRRRIAASKILAQAAAAKEARNADFTNEPLPSMREPIKIQGARAAPKTRAQIQREYRQRIAASKILAQAAAAKEERNADFTNEPLPSLREPIKIQGARAAPKSRAQIQREYRQRLAASRTLAQAASANEARNARRRNTRLRQADNLVIASGSLDATPTSLSLSGQMLNTVHIDTQRQLTDLQRQTLATEPAETTSQPSTSSNQIKFQAQ